MAALAFICSGCTTTRAENDKIALVPVNSLAKSWNLPLNLSSRKDAIRGLYLRDDTLFAHSQRNRVTAMSAADGKPLYAIDITPDQVPVKPPIIVKDRVAFPTGASIELYSKSGKFIESASTKRSIRSPGTVLNTTIYIGLDYPAGGRLAAIDLTRRFDRARWETMTRYGISAAPAVYQNLIYFADEGGAVYAISEDKAPAWPLDHSAFQTDGRIVADVKADDGGIYVASMDTKVYCLDPGSGRLRWQYYSLSPLVESPVITADTVYQVVPNVGVVAIDKVTGKMNRDAKWTVKGATRFISQDDKHVYLRGQNNEILACDRATGEVKFKSQRNDLAAFAINTKDGMIYASTRDGNVMAIKPVTTPGVMGTMVLAPVPLNEALASTAGATR
ncbi:MAG: PQQ-like beta-propeller repeat protein [Anaerolineae bacterium]|nr:PQQ-like beta-propeller repeat protein [Phycisphaerae bacterium]